MKICALIIAHKNASQLLRLIDALKHPIIDVYVHIDKKWKITDAEIEQIKSRNAVIISKRISCFLDEWNLVEASLHLITEAKKKADYLNWWSILIPLLLKIGND